jgi:sugar/nucleoside kinase (ribokinase family)
VTYRAVGIGEILWDRFPDGDRVGEDADGERLIATLAKQGLSTSYLQKDAVHPTGIMRVKLQQGQSSYAIEKPAAWDYLELTGDLKNRGAELDAVAYVDNVGAGDAFAGTLAAGHFSNAPLEQIADRATAVGAYVGSHAGALPSLPPEYCGS